MLKKRFIFLIVIAMIFTRGVVFAAPADLPKTGQTTSYATGDDGDLEKGVAWPDPRFTVGASAEADCVTDNLTGLMWAKAPDSTTRTWANALTYADALSLCGYTDWRLPNVNELESLVNAGQSNSATWLNSQGFSNVPASYYWSATTHVGDTAFAWFVGMGDGSVASNYKTINYYVWPVRAGQSGLFYNLNISKAGTGSGMVTSAPAGINCGADCSEAFAENTSATLTATPDAGSTFAGWSGGTGSALSCSGTGNCTFSISATSGVTATFTLNTYTISFNTNGGSAVSSQSVTYNTTATAPTDPTKTGNTFGGWYSDSGLTTSFAFTTAITANTTLYAKWTINQYTVSFNSNGGSSVSSIVTDYNTTISEPAAPTKTGYTFGGWYKEVGLTNLWNFATDTVTANTTLFATATQ